MRTPQGYNYAPALISVGGRKLRAMDGKAAARKLMGGMSASGKAAAKKASDIETSQDLVFRQSYENCAPRGLGSMVVVDLSRQRPCCNHQATQIGPP